MLTWDYHFFGVYAFSHLTRKQNTSEFGVITSPIIILILGTGDCGSEGSNDMPALAKGPGPDAKPGLLTPSSTNIYRVPPLCQALQDPEM